MSLVTLLFPLWAVLLAMVALWQPAPFIALKPAIVPLLMIIMLGMGMTLTAADFKRAGRLKAAVLLGVGLQYSVMPVAAYLLSTGLALPPELLVGMVLVGASAGGTASNVICYLARGDVALSISLTLVSTLAAVVAMPALTWLYAGRAVPVPLADMMLNVLQIIALPVMAGLALNTWCRRWLGPVRKVLPLVSMAAIVVIIAIIVALNASRLATLAPLLAAAVMLHNGIGLAAGYGLPRLLGWDETVCRTLAIEVGMQNSGLSVALAVKYFSAAAALPGALFSVWHNVTGSALAAWWRHDRS